MQWRYRVLLFPPPSPRPMCINSKRRDFRNHIKNVLFQRGNIVLKKRNIVPAQTKNSNIYDLFLKQRLTWLAKPEIDNIWNIVIKLIIAYAHLFYRRCKDYEHWFCFLCPKMVISTLESNRVFWTHSSNYFFAFHFLTCSLCS